MKQSWISCYFVAANGDKMPNGRYAFRVLVNGSWTAKQFATEKAAIAFARSLPRPSAGR